MPFAKVIFHSVRKTWTVYKQEADMIRKLAYTSGRSESSLIREAIHLLIQAPKN